MEELKKSLEALEEQLNEEIRKVTKKADITPIELDNMTKTLCLIEKIKMIKDAEESALPVAPGLSGRRYPMRSYGVDVPEDHWMNSYGMEPPMYDGMSGTRRSKTTGRYMSGARSSYGMPDSGYSGHSIKDRMVAKLEEMYDEAKTEHEKQLVDEWIARLEEGK